MKKISEMEGSELRRFLGIESICDKSISEFEAWDDKHMGRDYYRADDRRRELIEAIIHAKFVGIEDEAEAEQIGYMPLYNVTTDRADEEALVEELVNGETCNRLYDSVIDNVQLPEGGLSLDDIVKVSKAELLANFHGEWIEDLSCLNE